MRTLLIPTAFLTVFATAMLGIAWAATNGIKGADTAHGINLMQTIAEPWYAWHDMENIPAEREHADEVGLRYH